MKSLHTLRILNKAGETLVIYLDSDLAKIRATNALEAQGIDYTTGGSSRGYTLTGSREKQQASMLDRVKSWIG